MSEFTSLSERLDNVKTEVALMRASLTSCQTHCHVEREARRRHVRWTVAVLTSILAAVSSAALTHFLR